MSIKRDRKNLAKLLKQYHAIKRFKHFRDNGERVLFSDHLGLDHGLEIRIKLDYIFSRIR